MTFNGDLSPLDAAVSENSAEPITSLGIVVEQAPESLSPPHLPAGLPRRAPLQDAMAP